MNRITLLKRVALKCRDFVRQLAYHRAINPYTENLKTNIWIYTFNNFIDMAVLDWCHLFGNHKDDLHWRNIVNDPDEFKGKVLEVLSISEAEWEKYWESVKDYRDKDVAHIEVRPETKVPKLDNALECVRLYYSYAINELHENGEYIELPGDMDNFIPEVDTVAQNYIQNNLVGLLGYTGQS